MAGTREGGRKAAAKNLANNPNFYAEIGKKGGSATPKSPRGFAWMKVHDPKMHQLASIKGGTVSRRRPVST